MARVNTTKAVGAWISGQNYRAPGRNGSPIWTCGGVLYSYSKAIGKWSDADGGAAILNMDRYSCTTSTQQNGVFQLLSSRGMRIIRCDDEQTFNKTDR